MVGGAAVILHIDVCTDAGAAVLTEERLVVRYPVDVVQTETEGDRGLLAWFLGGQLGWQVGSIAQGDCPEQVRGLECPEVK